MARADTGADRYLVYLCGHSDSALVVYKASSFLLISSVAVGMFVNLAVVVA